MANETKPIIDLVPQDNLEADQTSAWLKRFKDMTRTPWPGIAEANAKKLAEDMKRIEEEKARAAKRAKSGWIEVPPSPRQLPEGVETFGGSMIVFLDESTQSDQSQE